MVNENLAPGTDEGKASVATKRPWFAHPTSAQWWSIDEGPKDHSPGIAGVWEGNDERKFSQAEANAKLICRAVNAHDALLSAVVQAQAILSAEPDGRTSAELLLKLREILLTPTLLALVNEAKAGA